METNTKTPCCPRFDPAPWDQKTLVWEEKLFVKKTLPQFLHMPWPGMLSRTIGTIWQAAGKAQAQPPTADFLWLAYDPSPWKSEQYIHVTREIPGFEHVRLSGTFLTRVFDGPYHHVPRWIKEMDRYLAAKGKRARKYYFYYTTCPRCAKLYGHNYVVVFAQI